MKKMICLMLALMMALTLAVPAFASGYSTRVDYDPSQANGGDTNGDGTMDDEDDQYPTISERYFLEVPAKVAPGSNGTVKAYGYLSTSRKATVTAEKTVTLTASGISETYSLAVTMNGAKADTDEGGKLSANVVTSLSAQNGFQVVGINDGNCYATAKVSVANFQTAPLLGVWSGTFDYTVSLADVA